MNLFSTRDSHAFERVLLLLSKRETFTDLISSREDKAICYLKAFIQRPPTVGLKKSSSQQKLQCVFLFVFFLKSSMDWADNYWKTI